MNDRCQASYAYWTEDRGRQVEFLILGEAWQTTEMDRAREDFIRVWKEERKIL